MPQCTIVISTANARILDLNLKETHPDILYIVIHQNFDNCGENYKIPRFLIREDVTYVRLDYSGLSKSRNKGLAGVKTKYAYIMDDDVDFSTKNIIELVKLMNAESVDIATCQFKYQDGTFPKKYSDKSFEHSILSSAKVASIEICVNIESIRQSGIKFDESFGLGTSWPSGEEFIFLTDCLKAGLKVNYYPIVVGIHPSETSGQDFYSSFSKSVAKREMFKRVFGWRSWFYIIAFWIKKLPIAIKAKSGIQFSRAILLGTKNK